ncbi:tetratricopeptide repeat protein [Streptomyces sp. LP11]|uniref:Tetratricopeptide repeat protein n=1 Tax=Streptomyces pyxinicus TaxID=2970331 RepID=A0ABT2B1W0_9ACTN|nr:tetratricopeptide repeat protein [Streptomyces sp. LP11]MCS0602500.1 tetratricopeptide repeat protein [Streptomyces sp. LP11]
MDNRSSAPGTSLITGPEQPRRWSRWLRRVLVTALAGGAVAGAVLALPPHGHRSGAPRPAAGPKAAVPAAVTFGVPAALPLLTEVIGQQERRVRERPRDARAWAVLGTAYVERGRRTSDPASYPKAEQALRTSLRVQGAGNTGALDGLAALALARRDFPAAKGYAEQAVKATPKRWSAYPPLIDAYDGLGDFKAARASLDKLLALHPGPEGRPAVMARASAAYRDRGWREDAVAQLTDAAAAAGTPAEQAAYLTGLGQLAWERGDLPDALRHFDAALRLDPDRREALSGRGRTLAAQGKPAEAVAAYQEALARQPSPRDTLELGELFESLGRTRDAEAQYELVKARVRQAVAGGVDEELLIGRYEADHGDPWEAVERLEAEWERQPGIEVADALGWALHRAGDDEEALTYATTVTDKEKGGGVLSALYAFHLGMIEAELDRTGPARRHLQQALRINPHFSPLRAPEAREALGALGDVPDEPLPAETP